MATELREGQKLKRLVRVYEVGLCLAEIDEHGITFKAQGSRAGVWLSWLAAVGAAATLDAVPSKLYGQPLTLLKAEAAKVATRRAKRESHD